MVHINTTGLSGVCRDLYLLRLKMDSAVKVKKYAVAPAMTESTAPPRKKEAPICFTSLNERWCQSGNVLLYPSSLLPVTMLATQITGVKGNMLILAASKNKALLSLNKIANGMPMAS